MSSTSDVNPESGPQSPLPDSIHKHAVWVLTTLIGFSLREVLVDVFDRDAWPDPWTSSLEIHRLFAVFSTCLAFLFGAARYFEERLVKIAGSASAIQDYVMGFIMAIFHFSMIFLMATACVRHPSAPVSSFLGYLWLVLAYNVFWMIMSRGAREEPMAIQWTVANAALLVLSCALYSLPIVLNPGFNRYTAEHLAIFPVVCFRWFDVVAVLKGFTPLARFFRKVFPGKP